MVKEKFKKFSSGRGIWTPDMQIMILLFWPTKLSRQEILEMSLSKDVHMILFFFLTLLRLPQK